MENFQRCYYVMCLSQFSSAHASRSLLSIFTWKWSTFTRRQRVFHFCELFTLYSHDEEWRGKKTSRTIISLTYSFIVNSDNLLVDFAPKQKMYLKFASLFSHRYAQFKQNTLGCSTWLSASRTFAHSTECRRSWNIEIFAFEKSRYQRIGYHSSRTSR